MKKIILLLSIIIAIMFLEPLVSSFELQNPQLPSTSITWPTGVLGRCPSTALYQACCYDAGKCGLLIGGICVPDVNVHSESSYTQVVQYYSSTALNDGKCATIGPKINNPGCPSAASDYSGDAITCFETYSEPQHTTPTKAYCTSNIRRNSAPFGSYHFDGSQMNPIETDPVSEKCVSYRVSNKACYGQSATGCTAGTCSCPTAGCQNFINYCRASYECIDKATCTDPAPVTVTAATCSDTYLNNLETDKDCGGNNCRTTNKCTLGKLCIVNTDCASDVCTGPI
ncbi:MAG: hypothetical protein AABY09_03285, partial [Nanoarchaeota archaeon]